MWNIEKIVSKGDYDYAVVKGHPNATENSYVLHHRIVMENHLNRLLNSNEVVHHKIQLQGRTHEVEKAISENIVREYKVYSHDNPEETSLTEDP